MIARPSLRPIRPSPSPSSSPNTNPSADQTDRPANIFTLILPSLHRPSLFLVVVVAPPSSFSRVIICAAESENLESRLKFEFAVFRQFNIILSVSPLFVLAFGSFFVGNSNTCTFIDPPLCCLQSIASHFLPRENNYVSTSSIFCVHPQPHLDRQQPVIFNDYIVHAAFCFLGPPGFCAHILDQHEHNYSLPTFPSKTSLLPVSKACRRSHISSVFNTT
jgi:hypothetical protein